MSSRKNEDFLKELVDNLDLPDSAYAKAVDRYEDLGKWFGRKESAVAENDPHVFPQGSFRLGIAIKPLSGKEEYDLDFACSLRSGITPENYSQNELKELVGNELELYRKARNIVEDLEEKHRCWRLEYADKLKFHMDIVPCVPENEFKVKSLVAAMRKYGINESLAHDISERAVRVTDDRHANYTNKAPDWLISNPEGYAQWFEDRMHSNMEMKVACEDLQVDNVPAYKQKTPLQRTVQVLKRHRDTMFKENPDSKPISVIITTLSGSSYSGSISLVDTLAEVLSGLGRFVESDSDVVLNPVNPEENFADRWLMPAYENLELKKNFHIWVDQVIRDFEFLFSSDNIEMISESISKNLSLSFEHKCLASVIGIPLVTKRVAAEPQRVSEPVSKPWHQS